MKETLIRNFFLCECIIGEKSKYTQSHNMALIIQEYNVNVPPIYWKIISIYSWLHIEYFVNDIFPIIFQITLIVSVI